MHSASLSLDALQTGAKSQANLRQRIEDAIESLLALLDILDGDPDLEPGLGAPEPQLPTSTAYLAERFRLSQVRWADGATDEREYDVGDQPQLVDDDGGLGLTETHGMGWRSLARS